MSSFSDFLADPSALQVLGTLPPPIESFLKHQKQNITLMDPDVPLMTATPSDLSESAPVILNRLLFKHHKRQNEDNPSLSKSSITANLGRHIP